MPCSVPVSVGFGVADVSWGLAWPGWGMAGGVRNARNINLNSLQNQVLHRHKQENSASMQFLPNTCEKATQRSLRFLREQVHLGRSGRLALKIANLMTGMDAMLGRRWGRRAFVSILLMLAPLVWRAVLGALRAQGGLFRLDLTKLQRCSSKDER